jgi:hypothetical protein
MMKMPGPTDDPSAACANRAARSHRMLRFAGIAAFIVWAVAVGAGLERMWRFKTTPGVAANVGSQWPGSDLIQPREGYATLVMFVHPQCSCTRASLEELRKVLEHARAPVSAWVLLLQPKQVAGSWQQTATARAARAIPNVTVIEDREGAEARRFNAQTSGQVALFDPKGQLLFEGGITSARGHVGDNAGEQRVLSLINTGTADGHEHAVFGCGIHERHGTET